MAGFAEIEVVGKLGRDPEIKDVAGKKLAKFSIAVSKKVKDQEITTWYKAELWEQKADLAERFLFKGNEVFVKGEPKLEIWTDKDGNAKAEIAIRVNTIVLIGGKAQSSGPAQPAEPATPVTQVQAASVNQNEDDLPF